MRRIYGKERQKTIGYFLGEQAQKVQPNLFKTQDTRQEALKSDTN